MSVGSYTFSGEDAQITIEEKSEGTEYTIGARMTSYNESGFERNIEYRQTFGTIVPRIQPFNKGTVNFTALVDVDSNTSAIDLMDGLAETSVGEVSTRELDVNTGSKFKIKLEFANFTGTYGTLGDSDPALRIIYYNAEGLNVDYSSNADGQLEADVSFQVPWVDSVGSSNYLEIEKTSSGTVSTFDTKESNKDTEMGY